MNNRKPTGPSKTGRIGFTMQFVLFFANQTVRPTGSRSDLV